MPPTYDMSPTKDGHAWYCNACKFVTPDYEEAMQHAIEKRDQTKYTHLLYERSRPPGEDGMVKVDAVRRIVTYQNGTIQTEVAPARKRATKGTK